MFFNNQKLLLLLHSPEQLQRELGGIKKEEPSESMKELYPLEKEVFEEINFHYIAKQFRSATSITQYNELIELLSVLCVYKNQGITMNQNLV